MAGIKNILAQDQRKAAVFASVLIGTFIVQFVPRALVGFFDHRIWTDQVRFFLTNDPRQFDFYYCYGHPGTTIVELGVFFHSLLGFSYSTSVTLSVSLLVAAATAACSVLCLSLSPASPWWFATALVVSTNRLYIGSTPTTSVAMPFVVLIVLGAWWLWTRSPKSQWIFFAWGAAIGISTATRYDVSLLVGGPLFLLVSSRHGFRAAASVVAGSALAFILADPYMWFMPVQHIIDLLHKFRMHYSDFNAPYKIKPDEFINTVWLASIGFAASLFFLFSRGDRAALIPRPIVLTFSALSLLSVAVVLSSRYQAIRYLFPLCIVWETFLPCFFLESAIETWAPGKFPLSEKKMLFSVTVGLIVFVQLAGHVVSFLYATVQYSTV